MPDSNLADASVLTSSFYNTYIREQVVVTCTSGTRPTGVEGRRIYETDTDRDLVYSGSAWVIMSEPIQSWSPTITQGSAVAGTVNRGWYRRSNGVFVAALSWTASAAGTGSNNVVVSLPVTMSNAADLGGSAIFNDAGTISIGVVAGLSTTTAGFFVQGATGSSPFGASPTTAIASGDVLAMSLRGTYT